VIIRAIEAQCTAQFAGGHPRRAVGQRAVEVMTRGITGGGAGGLFELQAFPLIGRRGAVAG
jgi:hypothetical protein